MTTIYVDSSSWCKLLKEESESTAFAAFVDAAVDSGDTFVSSSLLITEVLRTAQRYGIDRRVAISALEQINLFVPEVSTYRSAGLLSGDTLRTLDALHVAHCLDIAADVMASYDDRQLEAARSAGIKTVSPGR